MKLIQQLERRLSWRKHKKPSPLASSNAKSDLARKSKKSNNSAAIRVNDTEFSQYIRFANLLQTVPTSSVPSYEIVNIHTRSPFRGLQAPSSRSIVPCQYQSPSPGREAEFDMHIYDKIDCAHLTGLPDYEPLEKSRSKYSSPGPTTVTSSYRRNRIKTNPWCSSPWASKKSLDSSKPYIYNNSIENPYESIDNLNWQETKENHYSLAPISIHHPNQSTKANNSIDASSNTFSSLFDRSSPNNHRSGTYLKESTTPHHLDAFYPQSPLENDGSSEEGEHFMAEAPSPEFLNERHQICSEISNYFLPSPPPEMRRYETTAVPPSTIGNASKFDSMETIDLNADFSEHAMSVWSLAEEDPLDQTEISGGTPTFEYIPRTSKNTIDLKHLPANKTPKRKRPESIYSSRQAKKVDRLKSKLKEVVHAAILEAKKGDNKKV